MRVPEQLGMLRDRVTKQKPTANVLEKGSTRLPIKSHPPSDQQRAAKLKQS